jgi:hypothetical protein
LVVEVLAMFLSQPAPALTWRQLVPALPPRHTRLNPTALNPRRGSKLPTELPRPLPKRRRRPRAPGAPKPPTFGTPRARRRPRAGRPQARRLWVHRPECVHPWNRRQSRPCSPAGKGRRAHQRVDDAVDVTRTHLDRVGNEETHLAKEEDKDGGAEVRRMTRAGTWVVRVVASMTRGV